MTVLPFDNTVATLNMTGKELIKVMERALAGKDEVTGKPVIGSPQWAGLKMVYDPQAPAYHRVVSVDIAGKRLDVTRNYTLVTNDFVVNGGDAILDPSPYKPGAIIADVLADYLKKQEFIEPKLQGRVVSVQEKKKI
jgi:5'-nucleotidase